MKEIKWLVEHIQEELEGAEEYAKAATKYKETDSEFSSMLADMAHQELKHMDKLHSQAVKIIKAHKAAGHETPVAMQAVWDWEHEKIIDHTGKVKMLLNNI